nr:immunoglobulin heavy chain junction region [Macaca mulatta]MOW19156.1 immunoglobulin heavy chain junction region [Macaca mulatta]MOW20178.1 immunoglobulin heavy chain junction region [Macaca mulatta]MOW20268.1 immunoglobulin heavy chain junction region [Macaca mulatta]MOW20349.1 immunoglobulin heavy chain junction region [Macaca mulatta]
CARGGGSDYYTDLDYW